MRVAVGGNAERLIKASGRNDRLAPAAGQMRHRTAASLAERRGKAARQGQIETHHGGFTAKPAQRRGLHDRLAGMRGPACFAAARAVAVQEAIERSVDLEADLAAQAASAECWHARLPGWVGPR